MRTTTAIQSIEKETASLYSSCFERLNEWTDESWLKQGEMLFQNLGLTSEKVKGKKCMDGGCGHGTLSYQLLSHGAGEVNGVDLHRTLKAGMFEKFPNMHFTQASLIKLPFESATFDLIVSNGVLHHTAEPLACFKEFVRVLKPGGKIVLGVYGKHGLFPYTLWLARLFTVKLPIIPKSFAMRIIDALGLDPMMRYQLLDYLYVPCLERYSPREIIHDFFLANDMKDPRRVYGLTEEESKRYRDAKTVYTYDPRDFTSKILFGYGFIVVEGIK